MRRNDFLGHIGWTGAGIAWALGANGLLTSPAGAETPPTGDHPWFVQISDSHIGFKKAANPDVSGTLEKAVADINALAVKPTFVVHTGDVTHLATTAQFDTAKQILGQLKAPLLTIPGEHDTIGTEGTRRYFDAFGNHNERQGIKSTKDGWYSFDQGGVHFVALVNVFDFEKMGLLGSKQLAWLSTDLKSQKNDTPLVVFGHVPLYALYPRYGWTTEDGAKALAMMSRFDNVTVLNGHIHQIIQHTEGNIRFATAAPTAYPLPAPGSAAPKPVPVKVPKDHLLSVLGYRTVRLDGKREHYEDHSLAHG